MSALTAVQTDIGKDANTFGKRRKNGGENVLAML